MATRKKAAAQPAAAGNAMSADKLAEFIGFEGDKVQLGKAIDLATAAAVEALGAPMPEQLPHELAMGVKLLATKLLLTGQLDEVPAPNTIPLVVRYYFQLAANAANQ